MDQLIDDRVHTAYFLLKVVTHVNRNTYTNVPIIKNISTLEMIFSVHVGVPFISNVSPESS
jgi:hypothetical protein